MEVNTTLLREKFVIRDTEDEAAEPVIAVSNRLALPMYDDHGDLVDTLVIRAQNMHGCLRMAAQILQSFLTHGPILSRIKPFDFETAWDKACSDYETFYSKFRWVAVYHKGTPIFTSGQLHSFLNVIEKCDSKNPGNYDRSVKIAEDAFIKMGRKISISYDANIGMVLNIKRDIGRCGLIYRGTEKNSTFNFTAESEVGETVSPVHCLNICACFLEGLQLSFLVGTTNDKLRTSIVKKFSMAEKQSEQAKLRIEDLNLELSTYDNRYKIKFRPERPEFSEAIIDAERYHHKNFDEKSQKYQ